MKTVLEYLEYSAAVRPHAVAVEDAWGTATFQELEVGCRKVGSALTERIALREPVAIFLEKRAVGPFGPFGGRCMLEGSMSP